MKAFENKAISASAGSGKTFRLAHRYMGLLARGIPPDRICALTFSRKAAGEIFDSIVRYLTRAAKNAGGAELSSQYMEGGPVPPAKFLAALRGFLENLHRANIGTLDGFIASIVRAFPLELGLHNTEFRLMDSDGADAESLREGIILSVCSSKQIKTDETHAFLEAFKQATAGAGKNTFADCLDAFLKTYRDAYIMMTAEGRREFPWGDAEAIWKVKPWWRRKPEVIDEKEAGQVLQMIPDIPGWDKRIQAPVAKLISSLKDFNYDSAWTPKIFLDGAIQSRLIPQFNGPGKGGLAIAYYNKEYFIPDKVIKLLRVLYHNMFHIQFDRLCRRTRGIFHVIDMYEKAYEQALLQTGWMTFTDAQLILSPRGFASGGAVISSCRDAQKDRIFIDYRLDSKIDHWLLDEFQDTSNLQWQVLENLADEVLQDDSGARSFFYVGDIKQTIYRWRGGNPDLFDHVLNHYGNKITNEPLNKTQRSAQPIIDTVNKVFSRLPDKQANNSKPAISPAVISKWNLTWKKHECGEQTPADGYTAILRPVLPEGAKHHKAEDQLELLARLLKHIGPMERGLSTAVLVRTNKTGKRMADYLRQYWHNHDWHDLNVSYEGETLLCDNPIVTLLLDLLRYAEHPADNFAKQHVLMSPLGTWMAQNKTSAESLPLILLGQIEAQGFSPVIGEWAARLGKLDEFGRLRLQQMLEIAGQFDSRFDRNISLFIKTAERYGTREASDAKGCVHIMTIHQSKGLGFDLVILPDLNDSEHLNSAGRIDFLTGQSKDSDQPAWLLAAPDRKTAECDPTLKQSLEESDNLETLDNLCLLYVAMTRAKKALYIVTRIQDRNYFNMAAFLEQQLSGDEPRRQNIGGADADLLYETGNGNWFEKEMPGAIGIEPKIKPGKPAAPRKTQRAPLNKIEPSAEETVPMKASWLFKAESPEVLSFGSAIHELFREVEWSGGCSPDDIIRNWKPAYSYPDIVLRDVKDQFVKVLTEPTITKTLAKPAGIVELWREKSFDVILDNNWISGIFDRVVITRSNDGAPTWAEIIDFKSNRTIDPKIIAKLTVAYRPQINIYRKALARLLNLPEDRIEARLLFTVSRQIINISEKI